jgi:hypothetical protein
MTDDTIKVLQRAADCAGLEMEFLELKRDAERYRWLAARMLAADFDYMSEGMQVLVFDMPDGFRASADCDSTIDAAMVKT